MSQKKTGGKKTATEQTENTATTVMQTQTQRAEAFSRPAWIDGAPVDEQGRIIREGLNQPTPHVFDQAQTGAVKATPTTPESATESAEQATSRNWGDPYKAIFTCPEMGFELGEDRRFKQRVFRFNEKPTDEVLSVLKAHGFIYRASEKAWSVNATPESRKLTDDLARTWAGPNYSPSVAR